MSIKIIENDLSSSKIAAGYESIAFTRAFNSQGNFRLKINANNPTAKYIKADKILYISDDKIGYIDKITFDRNTNSSGEYITAEGVELKDRLNRLIYPDSSLESDSYTNEYLETIVKSLINKNAGSLASSNRQIPNLLTAANQYRGARIDYSARYKDLASEIYSLLSSQEMGLKANLDLDNKDIIFDVAVGNDLKAVEGEAGGIVLSVDTKTALQIEDVEDRLSYKNLSVTAGLGEGVGRTIEEVYLDAMEPAGYERKEVFTDARDIESDDELATRGAQKLSDISKVRAINVKANNLGSYQVGDDYDLGDYVSVDVKDGLYDAQVVKVKYRYEKDKVPEVDIALNFDVNDTLYADITAKHMDYDALVAAGSGDSSAIKGTFGSAGSTTGGDLPSSGNTVGDIYICDTDSYSSTVAGLTFNSGDIAIYDSSSTWVKSVGYTAPTLDDIPDGSTYVKSHNDYTDTDKTKVGYISVTQNVDLDDVERKANSALQNIIEDATPQLGGDLDGNSFDIDLTKTTNASKKGIITKGGNRFLHDFNYGNNGVVTTDGYNTFIGENAGNIDMGSSATANTHASYLTAVGYGALRSNTIGRRAVAIGYASAYGNTEGYNFVSIGTQAARYNTTGHSFVAIGFLSSYNNLDGKNNTTVGYMTGYSNKSGDNLTLIGYQAGYSSEMVDNMTALGYQAGYSNISGDNVTLVGTQAGRNNTTGAYLTTVGYRAGYSNTTGNGNVALGNSSLYSNTTGNNNTATGHVSLYSNTTGNNNTALGYSSLRSNITGSGNSAVGQSALYANTDGNNNTANGYLSLYSNTIGNSNVANGYASLYLNTVGDNNSALGYVSLYANTTGSNNTALGHSSLYANTTGNNNTSIGYTALRSNTTGSNITAIGYSSGRYDSTGADNETSSNSIYIGYDARPSSSGDTNEIVIGYQARGEGSNTVKIGNDLITDTYLKGTIHTDNGWSGTFTNGDGNTVTVLNGLITNVA